VRRRGFEFVETTGPRRNRRARQALAQPRFTAMRLRNLDQTANLPELVRAIASIVPFAISSIAVMILVSAASAS